MRTTGAMLGAEIWSVFVGQAVLSLGFCCPLWILGECVAVGTLVESSSACQGVTKRNRGGLEGKPRKVVGQN